MRTAGAAGESASPTLLLQVTAFVSTFDRFAMPPLLVAIASDLDVSLSVVVQVAAAYFVAYGVMQPVWGVVSDALGLVRTMRLTLVLAAVSTIVSAFATGPVTLALARACAGGFFGAAYPASLIYLGDTVPAQRRQREIAHLMVGVALGTALASVGAGLVADLLVWRVTFVLTGVAALVMAVVLRRLPSPERTRRHRHLLLPMGQVLRSPVAVLVLLLAFGEGVVLLGVLTLLPPAVEAWGATATVAGAVTGTYGVAVYASARAVGHLSRRLHPARLIGLGGVAALAGCLVVALSQAPAVVVVVAGLLGFGWAAMHSSLQTWATEVLPGARATVVSLFAGSLFLGSAAAAALVADLAEADRYSVIFLMSAAVAVPLGVAATWGRARWHRPASETF